MRFIHEKLLFAGLGCLVAAFPAVASAAESGPAEGSVSVGSDSGVEASGSAEKSNDRWIRRYRPHAHDLTLGIFGGVFFTDSDIGLFDPDSTVGSWANVAPDFGVRLGYYPLRHFGMEGEFAAIPTRNGGDGAFVYSARAQGVLQPGFWRLTPFAALGGGVIGVASGSSVVGDDTDQALHVGGGLKFYATKRIQLRVDVRDVITPQAGTGQAPAHNPEALLTLAFRFGIPPKAAPPPEAPADKDADGIADEADHCPFDAGTQKYEGCPIPDGDCDGVDDEADQCPNEAGQETNGCPPPDADGDGIVDERDQCPSEAGPGPDGCPDKDKDKDGIETPADKCPDAPETANGYEDADGCPDEVPAEISKFTGVIQGIFFDTGKDTIKSESTKVLDDAAAVLLKYEGLRVGVVGHTDDKGKREKNVDLSKRRAESVKTYLVGKGIDSGRVETRGAGPDEPKEDNKTKAGRAKNRRIEFNLLK